MVKYLPWWNAPSLTTSCQTWGRGSAFVPASQLTRHSRLRPTFWLSLVTWHATRIASFIRANIKALGPGNKISCHSCLACNIPLTCSLIYMGLYNRHKTISVDYPLTWRSCSTFLVSFSTTCCKHLFCLFSELYRCVLFMNMHGSGRLAIPVLWNNKLYQYIVLTMLENQYC